MFERFTERARQVVTLGQDEARSFKHNYIGTEHLLLGLLREEEGIAALVLEEFGITVDGVRAQVTQIVGQGDEVTTGQIPFTPRAKKVLELGLREALSLGHNYIGTEHLLLALVRANEGVSSVILPAFGADAEKIRDRVIATLSGRRRGQQLDAAERIAEATAELVGETPPPPPSRPEAVSFELDAAEQAHVDYVFDLMSRMSVRQWLALKAKLDQIDPPGGSFVREPRRPRGPRPGRTGQISLRETRDAES